jgi:hypothetical protein
MISIANKMFTTVSGDNMMHKEYPLLIDTGKQRTLATECVEYRPCFGGDSQARTPQLGRDQAISRQVLDQKGFLMSISISLLPR